MVFWLFILVFPVLILLFSALPGQKEKNRKVSLPWKWKGEMCACVKKKRVFDQLLVCGCSVHFRCGWLLLGGAAYDFAASHAYQKVQEERLGRVQMCSNSLHLLLLCSPSIKDPQLHPPPPFLILYHCRQPTMGFYEPCPPEEDESSHILPCHSSSYDYFEFKTAWKRQNSESPFEIASSSIVEYNGVKTFTGTPLLTCRSIRPSLFHQSQGIRVAHDFLKYKMKPKVDDRF